jgi:hypothetical protein
MNLSHRVHMCFVLMIASVTVVQAARPHIFMVRTPFVHSLLAAEVLVSLTPAIGPLVEVWYTQAG